MSDAVEDTFHAPLPPTPPAAPIIPLNPVSEKKSLFTLVRDDGYPPVHIESADLDELFRQARAEMLKVRRGYAFFVIDGVRCPVCQPQQVFAVTTPAGNKLMGSLDVWTTSDTGRFEVLVEPPEDLE